MAELVVVAVILGILVLALWPLARKAQRPRSPHDQDQVTDTDVTPPPMPREPLPGSRRHRQRHGKP